MVQAASWWKCEDGLSPFFWIWHVSYLDQSRGVVGTLIKEAPTRCMRPQRREKYPSVSLRMAKKMRKLVAEGYITEGFILVLTYFFSMPKVTENIRTVFDTTVSVLSNYFWSPNFMLPTIVSFLMMVGTETHMVDLDVGEMFYNFRLLLVLQIIV